VPHYLWGDVVEWFETGVKTLFKKLYKNTLLKGYEEEQKWGSGKNKKLITR